MEYYKFSKLSESQQFQAIQTLANGIMDELLSGAIFFKEEEAQAVIDLIKVEHLSVVLSTKQQKKIAKAQKLMHDTASARVERSRESFKRDLERLHRTPEIQEYLLSIKSIKPAKFYDLVKSTQFSLFGKTRSLYDDFIMPMARTLAQSDQGFYYLQDGEVHLLTTKESK